MKNYRDDVVVRDSHTRSSLIILHNSGIVIEPSVTLKSPHCWTNDKIEFLVMPGKMSPFNDGVISSRSIHWTWEKYCQRGVRWKWFESIMYRHFRLQRIRICSLCRPRSDSALHHTATALAVVLCCVLPFVHESLAHSSNPSCDRQHHPAMPLYIVDRPTMTRLPMHAYCRSSRRPD